MSMGITRATHFLKWYWRVLFICCLLFWFRLQPATKAPRGRPSPRRGAEENEMKTGRKPVGRDKGSLTEQQTEGKQEQVEKT